jgi:hypothetical protein
MESSLEGNFFYISLRMANTSTSEYPQCRDVSWNVLKTPVRGTFRMVIICGCIRHSVCTTNRFFEDVPRNVPTGWMSLSCMEKFVSTVKIET